MNTLAIDSGHVIPGATKEQLEQMAAYNHTELFKMNAVCDGGEVQVKDGVVWTYNPKANKGDIAFPHLVRSNAGSMLNEIMDYYRQKKAAGIGCWSMHPLPYRAMGVKLLARGFQVGWQPNWMAIHLDNIQTGHAVPQGLEIKEDNQTPTQPLTDLPYSGNNGAVSAALLTAQPQVAQRFIATLDGKIVGQSCVFFTDGEQQTAGLYEVGVVPAARNKGIGKAVVIAACLYARQKGYKYAILNGTGKKMYEDVGFVHISYGRTWWITNDNYIKQPPTRLAVLMAEAVGKGDIEALNAPEYNLTPAELDTPMINNMTLMQLAAHCKKPVTAEWLVQHGAAYTPLDAWKLGWEERTENLLKANPGEVNRRYGEGGLTLLHIAAEKDDMALAQLALSLGADVTIRDKWHNGIALGWAFYMGRTEMYNLLKKYMDERGIPYE